ncbi:MAG: RDD family protein [Terriglobales bacterium]
MSCPICGDHCRCAEPRTYSSRSVELAETDSYDPSEEQFASSLAGRESDCEQELASGSLASARLRFLHQVPEIASEPMESDLRLTNPPGPEESWRQEVSSRIQNYKARRRRSLGEQSLSFNFESTAGNHVFLKPEVEPEPEAAPYQEPDPLTYYSHPYATAPGIQPQYFATASIQQSIPEEITPLTEPLPPPPAPETAKLILFPKPPMMQHAPVDQLAEPVFDVPRILEAPDPGEAVMVPLADITLQPDPNEEPSAPYPEPFLELPVPVAPVAQRVFAEVFDVLVVLLATAGFAGITFRMGAAGVLTDKHSLLAVVLLAPAIFWSTYKYLFLVHGGATLGMRLAHLRLLEFDGTAPPSRPRRYRALAMLVSAFPLGLGLLWSFVDTETLCWHDRISRTYLTPQ